MDKFTPVHFNVRGNVIDGRHYAEVFHRDDPRLLVAQFYDQNCVNDAHLYIHAREVIDIIKRLVEWDGMGDAPDVLHEIVEDAKRIMTEVK